MNKRSFNQTNFSEINDKKNNLLNYTNNNTNKNLLILELYLIIFTIIFFVSLYSYFNNLSLISINLSEKLTNLIIMALSALSILKTDYHILTYK
ncbi:MAG: hypothetical protein QW757_05065 [Candidatus Woesearchaeota archaeon]